MATIRHCLVIHDGGKAGNSHVITGGSKLGFAVAFGFVVVGGVIAGNSHVITGGVGDGCFEIGVEVIAGNSQVITGGVRLS